MTGDVIRRIVIGSAKRDLRSVQAYEDDEWQFASKVDRLAACRRVIEEAGLSWPMYSNLFKEENL